MRSSSMPFLRNGKATKANCFSQTLASVRNGSPVAETSSQPQRFPGSFAPPSGLSAIAEAALTSIVHLRTLGFDFEHAVRVRRTSLGSQVVDYQWFRGWMSLAE